MKQDEFQAVLDRRIEQTGKTLAGKGTEYGSDSDRLHNFKAAGRMLNITPEKALEGMLAKHLVSVQDIVARVENGGNMPSQAVIDAKIGDCINYFILLEALLTERRDSEIARKTPEPAQG